MSELTGRLSGALADRYRIERHLGAGGMATVYLAQDLKHDRKVALKVLKPELAAVLGAERFVVEIKTTAALQHPHILPLFDSGTADGFLYYVMPYIEGETLRDKLNRETQLSVDEALRIAREVADALDYAHRHGVIHRDIKPENILLHDGRPMVADFGIALAVSAAAGGRMTETGLSLGTPHYMSPEQATADKDITARSDVYSLASVLYEMLTGNPPHTGSSAQQVIMKIITEPAAAVTQYRKSVPPNVAHAVGKALEKLPADRFATAKEFANALADASFHGTTAAAIGASAATPIGWRSRVALPALVTAAILLVVLAWSIASRPSPRPVSRFQVAWPAADRGGNASVDVSPDGSLLALASGASGGISIRRRDQLDAITLRDTEGAFNPSFSPDGREIAFQAGAAIRVMAVDGSSPPRTVSDSLVGVPGLDWGPDGYIYHDRLGVGALMRVRATGGPAEQVGSLDTTTLELQHNYPDVLPNGRGVLFTINRGGPGRQATPNDGIGVLDLRTGRHRELVRGIFGRYAASGHLLYVTAERELFAVGFDADRLELTGSPVALASDIALRPNGATDLAVANDGTLYYSLSSGTTVANRVVWISREGTRRPFAPELPRSVTQAEVSPDGRRVAYLDGAGGGLDAWIVPVGGGRAERLTFDGTITGITWSHDGRELFLSSPRGPVQRVEARAGAVPVPIGGSPRNAVLPQPTPDGRSIIFTLLVGGSNRDLILLPIGADSVARPLIATASDERNGSVSPDGRWLLYQSGGGSDGSLLVRPFPDTRGNPRQLTSTRGGRTRWSRNGREIFYLSAADTMVVLSVTPGADLAVTAERPLFAAPDIISYSPSPDGRILAVQVEAAATVRRLVVVENVFAELRRKVPR